MINVRLPYFAGCHFCHKNVEFTNLIEGKSMQVCYIDGEAKRKVQKILLGMCPICKCNWQQIAVLEKTYLIEELVGYRPIQEDTTWLIPDDIVKPIKVAFANGEYLKVMPEHTVHENAYYLNDYRGIWDKNLRKVVEFV